VNAGTKLASRGFQRGRDRLLVPRPSIGVNLSVWWGEAPFWSYDVSEAADVLIPKIFARPYPSPSRGLSCGRGQAHRSTDGRHRFSSPVRCSCNPQTRGSARPSALQDQVTLTTSILRSHLQDDREPRPAKILRPTLKLTPVRGRGSASRRYRRFQ
jgi:hypothetical protein